MTDDTKPELCGSVAANRYLRRAVDKCLADGIEREQVAEALVRMTEAVLSEIAEARDEYRVTPEVSDSIDQVPVGAECACGWVYSADHHFCSRCGSPLQPSIVPKAVPGRLQFERRLGNFLASRGFGFGVARMTIQRCWREISDAAEEVKVEGDAADAE